MCESPARNLKCEQPLYMQFKLICDINAKSEDPAQYANTLSAYAILTFQ